MYKALKNNLYKGLAAVDIGGYEELILKKGIIINPYRKKQNCMINAGEWVRGELRNDRQAIKVGNITIEVLEKTICKASDMADCTGEEIWQNDYMGSYDNPLDLFEEGFYIVEYKENAGFTLKPIGIRNKPNIKSPDKIMPLSCENIKKYHMQKRGNAIKIPEEELKERLRKNGYNLSYLNIAKNGVDI